MIKYWTAGYSILCALFIVPVPAWAIPSPELIIGSVSSLGQVMAVVFAVFSGAMATLCAKLGFKTNHGATKNVVTGRIAIVFGTLVIALMALNYWQYATAKSKKQSQLQATLLRPAQFAGTKIQDASLKETSFDAQNHSDMSISTQDANELLEDAKKDPNILFMDIRETAEREMGSLVNSSHQRFPDIQQSLPAFIGKQVILFCHNGNRSSETCEKLRALGIDCRFIAGGLEKWIVEGRPFSDQNVRGLSDLRAIPEYKNKATLLDTSAFSSLRDTGDLQVIDTRYPGDFAVGHLPNAVNIPLRALPTKELEEKINQLSNAPTVVACYDRRSCFMGQVLGWELSERGIDFKGRYTTPWEYFVPPTPKPHVLAWQAKQSETIWQKLVSRFAAFVTLISDNSHIIFAIFLVSLISRILVLPIAIKSERDQIVMQEKGDELKQIKMELAHVPARKIRAIKSFYADNGLTPLRNMSALLFLPVMMLGLGAIEESAKSQSTSLLWMQNFGMADPTYILPILFSMFAAIYLHFAVAKTQRQRAVAWVLGLPLLFALTFQLSGAGNAYLCISLLLLLVQRAYVVGAFKNLAVLFTKHWRSIVISVWHKGIIPLNDTQALDCCGNKALRLSIMKRAGFPVPAGVVLNTQLLNQFEGMEVTQKADLTDRVWNMIGKKPCAVRSSAANEDGEDQSFAGIFDSFLSVEKQNLSQAITNVLASFNNARSQDYSKDMEGPHQGNILIQQMVDSKYSGVLFTQNPQAPGQVLIELAGGTADDLVSGRVTPKTLRFGRFTGIQIGDESSPIELQPLLELAKGIETLFGCPQDIEWSFGSNGFEIVQSRDITTLSVGSKAELARRRHWFDLFQNTSASEASDIVLEQDGMSEVLPRPTPMSFSIMGGIWQAGGSVDHAASDLGLRSNQPEKKTGHLVRFFGKLYSDPVARQQQALALDARSTKNLEAKLTSIGNEFEDEFLPDLLKRVSRYRSMNFGDLPLGLLVEEIDSLYKDFVLNAYVFAEKTNILADIAMKRALQFCADNKLDSARVLQAHVPNSPASVFVRSNIEPAILRKQYLINAIGHRSVFDYEIADARYDETPEILLDIAESHKAFGGGEVAEVYPSEIAIALALQDLKERSKNEAMRVFAQLRRALMALAQQQGIGVSIFYLTIDEVLTMTNRNKDDLQRIAETRSLTEMQIKRHCPKETRFTLLQAEQMSGLENLVAPTNSEELSGTRVSGEGPVLGRCYVVSSDIQDTGAPLDGFQKGDVLICQMVHPAWLHDVIISGAVLSEIGGWLSHMAIVAREKNVNMFVNCQALATLKNGDFLEVNEDGNFSVLEREALSTDLAS